MVQFMRMMMADHMSKLNTNLQLRIKKRFSFILLMKTKRYSPQNMSTQMIMQKN